MKLSALDRQKGKEVLSNILYSNFKNEKLISNWNKIIIFHYNKVNKKKNITYPYIKV